jgi:hypothetical protein
MIAAECPGWVWDGMGYEKHVSRRLEYWVSLWAFYMIDGIHWLWLGGMGSFLAVTMRLHAVGI